MTTTDLVDINVWNGMSIKFNKGSGMFVAYTGSNNNGIVNATSYVALIKKLKKAGLHYQNSEKLNGIEVFFKTQVGRNIIYEAGHLTGNSRKEYDTPAYEIKTNNGQKFHFAFNVYVGDPAMAIRLSDLETFIRNQIIGRDALLAQATKLDALLPQLLK